MFEFAGKVAVITGAASGFGRAFAEKGASFGMKLVLADVNPEALRQTVDALRAGGADKCRYVVDTLGFDACVDYKAGNLSKDLKAVTPDGVDGYFENVGGEVLDVTLARMNAFGRIALCGFIAGYDGQPLPLKHPSLMLTQRLLVQGFIVSEHMDVWPEALKQLGTLVAQKKLQYRETIAQGLDAAPEAFIGLLKGKNFGKQLVKLI